MDYLQSAIAAAVLILLYVRMIKRELPAPIGSKQAVIPVLLGFLSVFVSTLFVLEFGILIQSSGHSLRDIANPAAGSLIGAFLFAGFSEEIAKFLMMLLSFKLFRPKNVYEYILIGAGVGIGFTINEEFLYGGSEIELLRLISVAMHTAFGIVMARYLGLAACKRLSGESSVSKEYALALFIPILLHTLYDAFTVFNPALANAANEIDKTAAVWLSSAGAAVLAGIVWQIAVLVKLKKRAEDYSVMKTAAEPEAPQEAAAENNQITQ